MGISAKTTNRPTFHRLMQDIKLGRIDTVTFTESSRLSRSLKDFLNIFELSQRLAGDLVCLKTEIDTISPYQRLVTKILVVFFPRQEAESTKRGVAAFKVTCLQSYACSVGAWQALSRARFLHTMICRRVPMLDINRITQDPRVMGGKPCVRGLRVTVGTIVGLLASGHSHEEILKEYPYLEGDDIQAARSYAAWRSEEVGVSLPNT